MAADEGTKASANQRRAGARVGESALDGVEFAESFWAREALDAERPALF